MSDPVPPKLRLKPRRAAPLQPDRPWRESEADSTANDAASFDDETGTPKDAASVKRQRRQAETALKNVREGYDD